MKRYQTTHWEIKIREIEVLRETDSFVFLADEYDRRKERREAKNSHYCFWYKTWEEAYAYLLQRAKDRISFCKSELEKRTNELRIIENMQKPKEG